MPTTREEFPSFEGVDPHYFLKNSQTNNFTSPCANKCAEFMDRLDPHFILFFHYFHKYKAQQTSPFHHEKMHPLHGTLARVAAPIRKHWQSNWMQKKNSFSTHFL